MVMIGGATPKRADIAHCVADDCVRPVAGRGLCMLHYQRWKRTGKGASLPLRTAEERFWPLVDKRGPSECWPWLGNVSRHGYGRFRRDATPTGNENAHRFSYRIAKGEIPDGFQVDHLCRNTRCVNPAHLEAVTPRVNTLRSTNPTANNAKLAECRRGHPFDADNTLMSPNGRQRICRTCKRAREAARRAA